MTTHADATGTRREARTGHLLRRRWRRSDRVVTAGLGLAALVVAVQIGTTAPATSPVQPAVPAAAVQPAAQPAPVIAPAGPQRDLRLTGDHGHRGDGGRVDGGRR